MKLNANIGKRNSLKVKRILYRSANWWQAMSLFFVFWLVITGVVYSIIQIQTIKTIWLKWLLIAVVLIVSFVLFIVICKCIWAKRDTR